PPHRSLHSFPTRRSSDLAAADELPGVAHVVVGGAVKLEKFVGCAVGGAARDEDRHHVRADVHDRTRVRARVRTKVWPSSRLMTPDRKSTRLNSSHVAISY